MARLPSRVIEIDFPAHHGRPYKCTLLWPNYDTRLPPVLTKSDLFGLLLDALIQLVDATDTSIVANFHEFFFRDQEVFQTRVRQWLKELLTLWVSYPWYKAWKNEWRVVFDPEAIWIRPPIDEDGFLRDMLIPGCLQSDSGPPFCIDYNLFSPNMDHPFVQESWAAMRRLRLRVMLR
ncbi:hypothetical protein BJX96DRAFT_169008 [Aspergillus floccosus]